MKKLLVFALLVAGAARAQTTTGQITGVVQDPSAAVITGAKVSVTQQETGLVRESQTNMEGIFAFPLLPIGTWTLRVEQAGFRPVIQTDITLQVNETRRVDVRLDPGQVSESIEVRADAVAVEREGASLGTVIDTSKITNLPLNSRNPFALALLVPGVTPGRNFGDMFNTAIGMRINGGRAGTNEVLLDGVTNLTPGANPIAVASILPSPDALQEFRIQTNSYSAEYGRTGGGVVNMMLRSGTNEFHGSAYEFLRNSRMDANSFFANRNGNELGAFQRNQFGGTIGGPVLRNRLFFFFSYEGLRQRDVSNVNLTVPTEAERRGDFSQSRQLVSGQCLPVMIYDPVTTRSNPTGSGFTRTQFPGNIIPANRFDAVGRRLVDYYPLPTSAGAPCTAANNFFSSKKNSLSTNQVNVKGDWNASDKDRFTAGVNWRGYYRLPPNHFGTIADSTGLINGDSIPAKSARLDYTRIQTGALVLNARMGVTRLERTMNPYPSDFQLSDIGLPSNLNGQLRGPFSFPIVNVANFARLGRTGEASYTFQAGTVYSWMGSATWISGRHTWKFGADTRVQQSFEDSGFGNSGQFNFARSFTQGPDPNAPRADRGSAVASLLLGTGDGFVQHIPGVFSSNNYTAFYAQDDIKVNTRLTVNLGVRYDIENGRKERFNQLSYFDFEARSPLSDAVPAFPNLQGGLRFVGPDNPRQFDTDWNNISPRVGVAWSVTNKTVIRSGYGIFYVPYTGQSVGSAAGVNGFLSNTPWLNSLDGLTPLNYFSNPFPNGVAPSTGASEGLLSVVGQNLGSTRDGAIDRGARVGYAQQWNFNIQQALPGRVLVEAAYTGSKGTKLMDNGWQLNQLTAEQLTLGPALQQLVDNPFFGVITSGPLAQPRVTRGQLMRPYPHFLSVVNYRPAAASSIYHAAQFRMQKEFTRGSSVLVSFTTGKLIDDSIGGSLAGGGPAPGHQDAYNRRADRSLSSQDISYRFVASAVYELPFGRNFPTWARAAFAQWRVNTIVSLMSGLPLVLTAPNNSNAFAETQRPNVNGNPVLSGDRTTDEKLAQWFDTKVFTQPAAFTFGNTGRVLPNVRADSLRNVDLSLFKEFRVTEGRKLELRAESFNLLNTPQFGLPGQALANPTFGVVNAQENAPRQIQLGLRLVF